ncbi:MAG: hypothetical protein WAM12_04615 [Pseudolabrys sp.]
MTDQNGGQNVLAVAPGVARARPRKPPSETENKIFALLRSIPVLKSHISKEHCRSYANYLNGAVILAEMNHQGPQSQRVGAKRTQTELKRLSDLAEKMARAMNSAHQETNALLAAALPKGSSLSQYKRVMNEVIQILHKANNEAGKLTAKGKKRSDESAAAVTHAAANAFTALTGRKAAPIVKQVAAGSSGTQAQSTGPFLDFLEALFETLGIDASADYHSRQLIRRNRS